MSRPCVLVILLLFLISCSETSPQRISAPATNDSDDSNTGDGDSGDNSLAITGGDILMVSERAGTGADNTMKGGAIIAWDKTGALKGVVLERDADNEVLRYPRGMRLEKDPFADEYTVLVGTTNPSLQMEIHRISDVIIPTESTLLTSIAKVNNTDGVTSDFFAFGFTAKNKNTNSQFLSDFINGSPYIHLYSNGGTSTTCYDYDADPTDYSGWYIGALFTGMGTLGGIKDLYVARYNGADWAIDMFSSTCGTKTLNLITGNSGGSNTYMVDISYVRSIGDAWDQNLFVTKRTGIGGYPRVYRYDGQNFWAEDNAPFNDTARAMFWQSHDHSSGRKIWTVEEDASNFYIRCYDANGNFEATLYTDTNKQVIYADSALSLVVIPE